MANTQELRIYRCGEPETAAAVAIRGDHLAALEVLGGQGERQQHTQELTGGREAWVARSSSAYTGRRPQSQCDDLM